MKLAIDLDGCCADFDGGWRKAYELWFARTIDTTIKPAWDDIVNLTHFADYDEAFAWIGNLKNLWATLPVIPGAQHAVRQLVTQHDVLFVTHRPVNTHVFWDTGAWLWENFLIDVPDEDGDWMNTEPAWGGVRPGALRAKLFVTDKPKSSFNCDLYIDDSPHVLDDLRRHNLPAVRFHQSWNVGAYGATAKSWTEVLALVDVLADSHEDAA